MCRQSDIIWRLLQDCDITSLTTEEIGTFSGKNSLFLTTQKYIEALARLRIVGYLAAYHRNHFFFKQIPKVSVSRNRKPLNDKSAWWFKPTSLLSVTQLIPIWENRMQDTKTITTVEYVKHQPSTHGGTSSKTCSHYRTFQICKLKR